MIASRSLSHFSMVTLHVSVWVEMFQCQTQKVRCKSRSTWACELKCRNWGRTYRGRSHAPRERVSWNLGNLYQLQNRYTSRSTWACELKLSTKIILPTLSSHAPRERVSWNFYFHPHKMNLLSRSTWACELKYTIFWYNTYINKVTLHVSVWVEMTETEETPTEEEVTLHVSVWVEIIIGI